jgi:hypothetical protein
MKGITMADRERKNAKHHGRDRYTERNQRWIGSGYWTNEPGFQEARRQTLEGDRQDAMDQEERIRDTRGPSDEFENNEFYANRGWSRSAAVETDRDWGHYQNKSFLRSDRLEIDFNQEHPQAKDPGDKLRGDHKRSGEPQA